MSNQPSPLTAIIVDDEPLAIEGLRLRLEKIPEINVIAEGSDGDEAIHLCQTLLPDVLFLDLNLPGLNGIEVVQALQSDVLPMIVFVSAHSEYALQAFELNAIDYVVKPANLGRLKLTVERILQRVKPRSTHDEKFRLLKALGESSGLDVAKLEDWLKSDKPLPTPYSAKLVIKNDNHEKIFLPTNDIRWIDAAGDYMCIHTYQDTHVVRVTMKKLENQLDPKLFIRIHKSTLVNINYVKSIRSLGNNESTVELDKEVILKVSRNYSSNIQSIVANSKI